ncbi:core-2-branching enzyme domain-containing protein [Janthinobacterium sp. HH01]|uniref:beta-1,6-N-acetylglucosaminyltransferase n=1 Tax=Janthinobacterium sp. HH01 TaxID=1198452 RepID=UPI0002AEAF2E|nr:beta-1,6-N-acetylglucosaminyltransferase [Janthinobacterium sp. HH01]ELX13300.1 core-2-branching enzyme domain-containing protein [Janthinobacterium sp. HH01]
MTKIAYLVLAHDQPALFGRLIAALQHDGATVYAHIDGKQDAAPFRQAAGALPVRFVDAPVAVNWGGYSQVEAMLKLLAAAAGGGHEHVIFLSGRDYPLRRPGELQALLAQDPQRNFINFYALRKGTDFSHRIEIYAFRDLYARLRAPAVKRVALFLVRAANRVLPARRFVPGLRPYRGSTSWCLSAAAVAYLLDFVRQEKNAPVLRFFRSVTGADEIFFQTILLNSPLAPHCSGYDDAAQHQSAMNENKVSLHYIDWNPLRENPAVLETRDFAPLMQSGKFFARKFDQARSAELLDRIDRARRGVPA